MKIYTLVGQSGTGKSYRATQLMKELNIDGLIDDGLFIFGNTVVEGLSAKKAKTKIGAVKVAIFINEDHRIKVRNAIRKKKPASLLILGTSDEMTNRIMRQLELEPEGEIKRIYIEDITTEQDRENAREQRDQFGKHVIPVPALQLKRNFAGYFMDRVLKGNAPGASGDRTVVRPSFSYLGQYFVTENAIRDIILCTAENVEGIAKVIFITQSPTPESYKVELIVRIRPGYPVWETAKNLQQKVTHEIENMTAFNMAEVNIDVRSIGEDN